MKWSYVYIALTREEIRRGQVRAIEAGFKSFAEYLAQLVHADLIKKPMKEEGSEHEPLQR